MNFKSSDMRKLHVWLSIVQHEKMAALTNFYKPNMMFKYNIFYNTYMLYKTEKITAMNKACGNK